ncbi:unnamed protein product [Phytophthora lilii]|uniref:Unnamed protein product n=1 Tax=Phytophthora lilii TaxID=2077276 RepID=A0A9W6TXF9_9STRA|nr:unnamed protein product [Phytophthora lilii]
MPLPGDDGGVVGPADTERAPQSYASSSASTALASLSEEGDCGPEQLQKLEYVVTRETKKLQSDIEQQREEEQQQSLDAGGCLPGRCGPAEGSGGGCV